MNKEAQRREVDRNYDAFQRGLATYLQDHRGQYALMKDAEVIDFYNKPGDAYDEGTSRFAGEVFSIQEVTNEPIDLGFFSRAGG